MASAKPHKLGKTLEELESAFADWEALQTDTPVAATAAPEERKDTELRKKTKKLLEQLREQLSELED